MKISVRAVLILFIAFAAVSSAFSATWNGGGADNFASTAANWNGNVLPPTGDSIIFDGTSLKNCTWDITGTYSALTIDGAYAGAVTINSTLTLSGAFIPPNAPAATTNPVRNNAGKTATLNATVNPNGAETSAYFQWGTTTSYGNATPPETIPTGTSNMAVTADITGLTPNTPYHYRIVATNSIGTTSGSDVSFTTPVIAPSATTNPAGSIAANSAALNGIVNPNGAETSVYFEWGLDISYGNTTATRIFPASVGDIAVTTNVSGLKANTTYHCCVIAVNSAGTTYGADVIFATLSHAPPFAETDPATNKNGNSATLNTTVSPNGLQTSVYFEWGLTASYGNTTSIRSLPAGIDNISASADISGLSINTTYHYRVVAVNADGTTNGADMTFTTPPITIAITSPDDGGAINRPDIVVAGTLSTTGNETGITVNGIVGIVFDDQFAVNHVPLADGANTISVTATDTQGNKATTAITVTADTSQPYATLMADTESGIAPLTVNFLATTSIPNAISTYKMDFDGDEIIDYSGSAFDNISYQYSSPGIYFATLTVVDTASDSYTDMIAIAVLDQADLDALLRGKWNAMRTALANKDVNKAITYMSPATQPIYEQMYNAIIDQLPAMVATQTEFNFVSFSGNVTTYELVTSEDGDTYSHEVIFVKDDNGIWALQDF